MCAAASGWFELTRMHGANGLITTTLIHILEAVFAIGVVGSALVIILSSIEDARTLRNKD